MDDAVGDLRVFTTALNPAVAEVLVTVARPPDAPAAALRGRLNGPRSAYSSTIEVAYTLKPVDSEPAGDEVRLRARVTIPEPNWWEPATPFVYEGPVEVWEGDARRGAFAVTHCLRDVRAGGAGLRLNGRPFRIRGVRIGSYTAEDLRELHAAGCNTLIVAGRATPESAVLADRHGFLLLQAPPQSAGGGPAGGTMLSGMQLSFGPTVGNPDVLHCMAGRPDVLAQLGGLDVPRLLDLPDIPPDDAALEDLLAAPGVLGWICDRQ